MMDQEGDIAGTKARMPVQPIPDITREVLDSYTERECGFRTKKTFTVSPVLRACAEDELVKKEYKEMRCDIPGLTKSTFLMVFSPDGTKMASTHGNHNVYVTDLRTGKNIKTLVGHPRTPWCVAFHPSSNQILASGCLGGQVRIWDLSGGSEVWTAESPSVISSLAFHPVDRLLVIATYNELYFWDWSQPKPFMQTCTSNAKEKVRYVAFDRLGHKLITGIANTPQGFTRWERVRAPVSITRHNERIAAYRRRITPRLVHPTSQFLNSTPPDNNTNNQNSIPERERRIAVCYRNLVEQYEMLVHRYLEVYRPATTIDRGTDPMEAEHLNSTEAQTITASTAESVNTPSAPITVTASTSHTAEPSTSNTNVSSSSRQSPPVVPGPSGLSRPSVSRPNKRSNVPGTKSDSSTVYQSDSSSSSSSDESPTPKRRISLVPNSTMFRNKSEPGSNLSKNVKDSSTCTRKKLFMSRPSAFHLTRASNSQNCSSGNSRNRLPVDRDRFTTLLTEPRSRVRPSLDRDRFTSTLPRERLDRTVGDNDNEGSSNTPNRNINRSSFERERFTPTFPRESSNQTVDNNDNNYPSNTSTRNINSLGNLSFTLDRLRGISEGSLSSADEVINFSERPIGNREEPEAEPTENFTPDLPGESEFPQQPGGIESIYSHILNDLETNLREARNSSRPELNRNTDPSNLLASFSERLENIMNQSDAILANLRRSMEMLMEPSTQQNQNSNSPSQQSSNNQPEQPSEDAGNTSQPGPSTSGDSGARRIFILRKPSGFLSHHRQCLPRYSGTSRSGNHAHGPSNAHTYPGSSFAIRGSRYFRIRQSRFNLRPHASSSSVWRPFDDHSYPRDPETNASESNQRSNVEPIRSLLTLSPRSPSAGIEGESSNVEQNSQQPERSSTPALFPSADHNYPLPDPVPSTSQPVDVLSFNENPIADHTYPRDPQNSGNNANSPDYIAPLVSSLHSTISHISMQTNLLRRQVESIEMIDRARFEVFQLQELRRMWEEIRRHVNFVNSSTSERRSNLSNVRQMMAWTRISDPSPSSESAQSSTEQSTPEPSPSTPDRPTPSTSRSSASSSNESRPQSSQFMSRFRQCHIKKRMYWRRRLMKYDNPHLNPRRYLRGHSYREVSSRLARSDFPSRADIGLTEVHVFSMVRGLEHLLTQQSHLLGRRDYQNSPDRNSMQCRLQSEHVIQSRLRAARMRLNRINQSTNGGGLNYLEDPVEYSSLGSRNDWIRYETRLRLSGYIETLTRFIENHSSIPPHLSEQIKVVLELALLLTDLLLLQIMESIPSLSGSILDPERQSLSRRITQMCTNILQNDIHVRPSLLLRIQNELRYSAFRGGSDWGRNPLRRNNTNERPENPLPSSSNRPLPREAMLDLNRQLRRLYQFSNYLNDPEPYSAPPPPPGEPSPGTSTENNSSMSHVHRLGDLLVRLRNIRGRLEQVSQSAGVGRIPAPGNSSSTTEHEPARSTDESPSDRESEPFEGFQSQWDQPLHDSTGSLYRTQHINLYPPDPPSSSQSSPERLVQSRSWNVPTVQVNDVPIAEVLPNQPRIWLHRYPSDLRPLSAATGLFRPRFLIPLYAGVNPFDADLDDPQREGPVGYDGIMTTTVSPNHRIQMWDISKCNIPNISNHEKNVVVAECKIHNDGSVDISNDGTLLVTLLPSGGYLNVTNRLGIYSIKWDTLGQCLYTTSFEQNAISVSLSPLSRHLIVGLASRRVTLLPSDRWTMARIFLLDDINIKIMGRGRLVVLRDLEQGRERDLNFMSVNCIKWMPVSGQGIVYATNTGQLKVLT